MNAPSEDKQGKLYGNDIIAQMALNPSPLYIHSLDIPFRGPIYVSTPWVLGSHVT